ncbi:MAG TPA: hypothetical protein VIT23_02690 [Terrimicrobiaceae bacterium]
MTFRSGILLAVFTLALLHRAVGELDRFQSSSNSALEALSILPPEYQQYVVKVSADNGSPNPPQWYVLAYRGSPDEGLFTITVANGEIVQEKPSLNVGELFRNPSPIAVERMRIDSTAAFEIAEQFSEANNKRLQSVSYVLQQRGEDSAPVWKVWCYDRAGNYFGYLEIAATEGAVISSEGLPNAP